MEKRTSTVQASIRMGEMSVAAGGEALRTLLGSCVGLALYDRRRKIGGLAHIVLPCAREKTDRPGKFVDTAVPALIERMEKLAGIHLKMTAKLAGGASMFSTALDTNIGLGYVRNPDGVDKSYLQSGSYELEVAGERHPCELQLQALYDPLMKRMKI